ncbi:hypothetical protein L798_06832 [Zootermopsis nevadensis]|uniref:Uncharacterized protein n=1 Tax=Zootermopsis nevadensis TaxID=136037 RepID=A0A067QH64_ZOONE|nr:hypothetical protein L798_06832 [Zootermopsis nevadensis]
MIFNVNNGDNNGAQLISEIATVYIQPLNIHNVLSIRQNLNPHLRISFQSVSETIYILKNLPIETQNLFENHTADTKTRTNGQRQERYRIQTLVMNIPQTNATNFKDLLKYQTQTDVYGMSTTLRM